MTPMEIPSAVDRIAKNPHAVESMSKEDLYDIMTYINTQHGILAQTFHSIYGLNEKFQDVSFDVYLSRQSMNKDLKKKFDIVETEYNKRINKDSPNINYDATIDVDKEVKVCLLKELGIIDLLVQKKLTNNKIAELITFITSEPITKGAANMALSRIHNEGLMDKRKSELANLRLKFSIKE